MISFKDIVESGLLKTDTYQKKRGIVLSNHIALILSASLILLFMSRLLFFHNINWSTIFSFLIGFAIFLFTIVLNRLHFTTFSRLYLCLFPVLVLWYISIKNVFLLPVIPATDYDSLRIFLLALTCIPYLVLDRKQIPIFVLGILPVLISILFMNQILNLAGIGPEFRGTPGDDFGLVQMRTIVSFLMISSCCMAFQIIIISNDEFNQRLVNELREKTNEIEMQNEELIQGQENLNEINQHLERLVNERTQKVRDQNEILLKYAYTNAHHVRGPVARVLGLIDLSKMETELDYPWFFEKVEHEARTIDSIIKRIGSELGPEK